MKTIAFLAILILAFGAFVHWRASAREAQTARDYAPQGQLIDVDGVRVHAEVMGSGPDVILLHGAGGNTRDFTFSLAPELAKRYRVTVFDRPGLGWTDRAAGGYDGLWTVAAEPPLVQADLLQKAAAKLGIERPIVVGQSFGGSVAYAWALSDPTAAGIVSIAGVANPWPGGLGWLYHVNSSRLGGALFVPLLAAFVPKSYVDTTVSSIFTPMPTPDGYLDHVGSGLTLRRASMRANARQVMGLRPHVVEMSARYGEIDMPVEIVHGDADTIVPLAIHSIKVPDQINGANLTILKGAGHMPHHSHQDEVIAAIDRVAARAGLR
ncbi:MAG: alpha/beta hydrolase [Rhodobacteraceae bacterium]|nr:alpha/beta hydrolase [Paracoccaceae bacterium]